MTVDMSERSTLQAHNYIFNQDFVERSRLSDQYKFMKKVLDRESAVPEYIDLNHVNTVLDAGCGTMVWTLDLLSSPSIQLRASPKSGSESKPLLLYACDITDAKFPSPVELKSHGIISFLHDVTKPFPDDMKGYFDLVNMRYLRISLSPVGWELALKNLSTILKPGGTLCLAESDNIAYGPSLSLSPPLQGQPHDIEASMRGKTWIHKLNAIFIYTSRKNNYFSDTSCHLPALLEKSGFCLRDICRTMAPLGKTCSTYVGFHGSSLAEEEVSTAENLRLMTELQVKRLFAKDELSLALGYSITSEAACQELLQEINTGCKEEGCALVHSEFIAIKKVPEY